MLWLLQPYLIYLCNKSCVSHWLHVVFMMHISDFLTVVWASLHCKKGPYWMAFSLQTLHMQVWLQDEILLNDKLLWLKVTLEVNVNNKLGALALYKQLSFIRAKRLYHYYLNGMGAFRLKLLFPEPLRIL